VSRFSSPVLKYFREHAVDPAVAAELGVTERPGEIIYPTRDIRGDPLLRSRLLAGGGPKFAQARGRSPAPWWPCGKPDRARGVIVTEGEVDGLAAICALRQAPGIFSSYEVVSAPGTGFPARRLVGDLVATEAEFVVLAPDADAPGDKFAQSVSAALAEHGIEARRMNVRGDDLSDDLATSSYTPGECLAERLVEAESIPEQPSDEAGHTFDLLTGEDLLALPAPSCLIDGLLPDTGMSALYGNAASAKTFLGMDWAASVAAGIPWHGRAVKQRPVVYVAAEGKAGLGVRYGAWLQARGLRRVEKLRFLPEAVNLLDEREVARVRRTLDALPERPALVVVDTMAQSMPGGDENSAKDVGRFIHATGSLADGGAGLVIHHSRYADDKERGSTALRGAATMMALLKREGRTPRVTLSCQKMREGAEWPDIDLRMEPLGNSCVLTRVEPKERGEGLRRLVLDAISANGPLSRNAIQHHVHKRRDVVSATLRELENDGLAVESDGGWQAVPEPREPPRTTTLTTAVPEAVPNPVPIGPEPPGTTLNEAPGGSGSPGTLPRSGGPKGTSPSLEPAIDPDHELARILAKFPEFREGAA
jgi:hypothetical protein